MVSFAYAAARSQFVEPVAFAPRAPRTIVRQAAPAPSRGSGVARGLMLALISMIVLGFVGWAAAQLMDSALLGFVFADLVFLVGIALRNAVAPRRGSRSSY